MDKQDHGGYKRELDIRREDSGMKVFTLSRCREINFKSLQADIGQLADDYDMQHMKAKQDAEHKEVAALGTHAQTHVQQPPPQQPSPPPQQNQQGPPPQQNQQGPPPQQNQYQNNQYQNNQYQSGQFNTPPPQQQQYQTPPPQQVSMFVIVLLLLTVRISRPFRRLLRLFSKLSILPPLLSWWCRVPLTPRPRMLLKRLLLYLSRVLSLHFTFFNVSPLSVFAPTFTTVGPPQNSVVCRFCGQVPPPTPFPFLFPHVTVIRRDFWNQHCSLPLLSKHQRWCNGDHRRLHHCPNFLLRHLYLSFIVILLKINPYCR